MKRITLSITSWAVAVLLLYGLVAIAHAQTTTSENSMRMQTHQSAQGPGKVLPAPPSTRSKLRASTSARARLQASTTKARIDARQNRQAVLSDRIQQRVTNLAANISNRIDAAIARFHNIIGRLESRMNKLQAQGVDTSEAKAHLANAKAAVSSAQSQISNIDNAVAGVTGSPNPRETWRNVRSIFVNARKDLKEALVALHATIASLKTAVTQAQVNAGSSTAVHSNNASSSAQTLTTSSSTVSAE